MGDSERASHEHIGPHVAALASELLSGTPQAGGRTGHLVVEEALRAGHHVTAAMRAPEKSTPITVGTAGGAGSLDVVRADVRDPDSVKAAVLGHDTVISAIGPAGRRALGLYSDAARALVTAMESTGVDRVIAVSSAGVRRDDLNHAFWY